MNVERIDWQPGNGTRYDIVYAEDDKGRIHFTWLYRGGSGGSTFSFEPGGYVHHGYLMEKMDLRSMGDAAGLLAFLHTKGHSVGMPSGWDGWFRLESIKENNLDSLVALQ
jgi:hypothetical protein